MDKTSYDNIFQYTKLTCIFVYDDVKFKPEYE